MTKKYRLVTAILLVAQLAQAQTVYFDNKNEFANFDYNIKQIDEFIARFNLKKLLIQPNQSQYERKNRMLLFDMKYYSDNLEKSNDFLNAVEEQQTKLSFYDSTWCAIAKCNVTFRSKKDTITLTLRTEQVKDDIYKWSIADAKGHLLESTPKTQSDALRLLPTDNEVNFIALQNVTTNNAPNITLYSEKKHVNDRLSVFNWLVYNKLLKMKNVQELSYCFTQVKGYKFYVKNFIRNERNAGWLIYDVQKETTKEPTEHVNKNDSATATQKVLQLYRMLSDYAKDPANITLAKDIQSLFYKKPNIYFFFENKIIYDDIRVFYKKITPLYAYVLISEYLSSIEDIVNAGITLSYQVGDFKINPSDGNKVIVTYKVDINNKDATVYEYHAKAIIQDGLIVSIMYDDSLEVKTSN